MLMKPMVCDPVAAPATLTQIVTYRDQHKAIDYLCAVFGFHRHNVVTNPDGSVQHALLTLGGGTIMLMPAQDLSGRKFVQPDTIGGAETQACYFTVPSIERHYERAVRMGADITWPLQNMGYGGVGYAARDVEGHVWSFGTYQPKGDGVKPSQVGARVPVDAVSRDLTFGASSDYEAAGPADNEAVAAAKDDIALSAALDPEEWSGIKPSLGVESRYFATFCGAGLLMASLLALSAYAGLWAPASWRAVNTNEIADANQAVLRLQESVAREASLKDAAMAKVVVLEGKLQELNLAKSESGKSAAAFADGLRQHIQNLEGSLAVAERANDEARRELATERNAKVAAMQAQRELEQRLAAATAAVAEAEAAAQGMRTQLQRLEIALANSETSSKSVAAELDAARRAKAAAQNDADGLRQSLANQHEAQQEADNKFNQAIADLRRQLSEEQKARSIAESSAAKLRDQIEATELTKAAAASQVTKIKSKTVAIKKVPRVDAAPVKRNAPVKRHASVKRNKQVAVREVEAEALPMGGSPKNPGWKSWPSNGSPSTSGKVASRVKEKQKPDAWEGSLPAIKP